MKLIKGYQQWLNENFQPIFEWAQPSIQGLIIRTQAATTGTDGLDLNDYNAFIANTNLSETFSKFVAEFKKAGGIDAQTVLAALLAGSVKKKVFFKLIIIYGFVFAIYDIGIFIFVVYVFIFRLIIIFIVAI